MGNSNSTTDVIFDRPQPTVYYTGEIVSGQVHFTLPEHTNQMDGMYLVLIGDVGCITKRTRHFPNGLSDEVDERHNIRILGEKVAIKKVTSNRQISDQINDTTTVQAGQYTYAFSVRLPDYLPPTIHPTDYPFVRYELQLVIDKKWYRSNTRDRYPLRVYPRVDLRQINNSQCPLKFDTKNNDLIIKGILHRSGLLPGQQINLSLEIYNPKRFLIKRLDICLLQRYDIEGCRRRLELMRLSISQLSNRNDDCIQTDFPITIPRSIPPSYNFKNTIARSTVHVNISYDLKLEFKIRGLFSDIELQVPVIVGTDSADHSSHTAMPRASTTTVDLNTIDVLELKADVDNTHSTY